VLAEHQKSGDAASLPAALEAKLAQRVAKMATAA
jgi:hypothetical protein